MKAVYLILLILLVHQASAIHISGSIYDYSLEPLKDVIVTIDEPQQQYISKDSTYSFELVPGAYTLRATFSRDNQLLYVFEENISITVDSNYIYDIIMFPSLSEEEGLSEDFEIDVSDITEEQNSYLWYILPVIFLIFILVFFLLKRKKNKPSEDEIYCMVLGLIRKHRRITQKEIRKQIPMSEAKISLVITELEEKGVIKKIKKGRGNIIILK